MHYSEEFSRSLQRVLEKDEDAFFQAFYDRMLDGSPAIAVIFKNSDLARIKGMLQDSLKIMADFGLDPGNDHEMQHLAQHHARLRIKPEFFDVWVNCLVATVMENDPEASEATELAWHIMLSSGCAYMKYFR